MGRIIPYIMENKKCLKPPTSYQCPFLEDFINFTKYPPVSSVIWLAGVHPSFTSMICPAIFTSVASCGGFPS
jgi:hypothetical protein